MGRSRRARRKAERTRTKRVPASRGLSPVARIGLAALGILMVVAGVLLLTHGTLQTEKRLARIAGILILIGLVVVVVAVIGKM